MSPGQAASDCFFWELSPEDVSMAVGCSPGGQGLFPEESG